MNIGEISEPLEVGDRVSIVLFGHETHAKTGKILTVPREPGLPYWVQVDGELVERLYFRENLRHSSDAANPVEFETATGALR